MSGVLEDICADKRDRVAVLKRARPQADIEAAARAVTPPRGFHAALRTVRAEGRYGLIAEIKKASPSRGLIRADFDAAALAAAYAAGGAACLSVLTEERWFQGGPDKLVAARAAVSLPVLRKDFIVDPWQVAESRAMGADAILLIVASTPPALAREIEAAALDWGLDVLVEAHSLEELEAACELQSRLIGINHRDLKTLRIDPDIGIELAAGLPDGYTVVGESGLRGRDDLDRLAAHGITAFLVGESLMAEADVTAATRRLLEGEA